MVPEYEQLTKRQRYEMLRSQLDNERQSFMPFWREVSDFVSPMRFRTNTSDTNRGQRKNTRIIDPTATLALRTLSSGMMAGVTSPARPWFRLSTPDPELSELADVESWLYETSQRMATMFLKTNLYNALPICYSDMGSYGTSAVLVEEDMDAVMRFYPQPIGSYFLALNDRMKVDVFFREFRLTIRQVVQKFVRQPDGKMNWDVACEYIKECWERGRYEEWIDICHVIQPNDDYDMHSPLSKHKKYSSCYYERGSSNGRQGRYLSDKDGDRYLRESGYDFFPVLAPRWEVAAGDVYGTNSPVMTAIGGIKALQQGAKMKAIAIEKGVNPPMTGPTSMKNARASILPADITFVDVREGQQGFRAAHEMRLDINALTMSLKEEQDIVRRCLFEDLFLMLASSDRREITAREIDERHEEKLLAIGPVLEQLNQDLLDPLIDIEFDMMVQAGRIPQPPEELQGQALKVEYVSPMAQAQKTVGIAGIERFASFAMQVIKIVPEAADTIKPEEMINTYGEFVSIPPNIIRTEDEIAAIRQQRQQAQQQAHAAEMISQGAGAAKNLSQADTSGQNALTQLMQQAQAGNLTPQ